MSWSINIGRIAGAAVRIPITFVLFLGWIFFATYAAEGPKAALANLVFLTLLFACVLAHEFGHIFTARAFGVATPDVTLLPIGGVARLDCLGLDCFCRRASQCGRSHRDGQREGLARRQTCRGKSLSRAVQHDPGL